MKQPVAGVTFYKGYRIVFDGERFSVVEDTTGRVVAHFYTMQRAKDYIDTVYA
jgi:hypothetical protein